MAGTLHTLAAVLDGLQGIHALRSVRQQADIKLHKQLRDVATKLAAGEQVAADVLRPPLGREDMQRPHARAWAALRQTGKLDIADLNLVCGLTEEELGDVATWLRHLEHAGVVLRLDGREAWILRPGTDLGARPPVVLLVRWPHASLYDPNKGLFRPFQVPRAPRGSRRRAA